MSEKFRWGIIAPGNIAEKFASSINSMEDAEIYAVASRSVSRAQEFASNWSVGKSYGSYLELVKDPQVQAVYISSPHRYHKEQIEMALNHGKHVLCEKPITVNAAEFRPLVELARKKGLFLMEAMWSCFIPTYQKLKKEWLAEGRLGEIRRIEADFSFDTVYDPAHRLYNPELAGGALLDVGIYPLNLAYWLMGRKPDRMVSLCSKAPSGVDASASVILQWDSGTSAVLHMGVNVKGPRAAGILGTRGMVELPMPFYGGERMIFRNEKGEELFERKHAGNGFDYEIREAMRCIDEGLMESPDHNWTGTLDILEIMDELRAEWGVRYSFEDQ